MLKREKSCMGLMFSLAFHSLADYRDELGDYYSDRPFCRICMDHNGNTEIGECQNRKELIQVLRLIIE